MCIYSLKLFICVGRGLYISLRSRKVQLKQLIMRWLASFFTAISSIIIDQQIIIVAKRVKLLYIYI